WSMRPVIQAVLTGLILSSRETRSLLDTPYASEDAVLILPERNSRLKTTPPGEPPVFSRFVRRTLSRKGMLMSRFALRSLVACLVAVSLVNLVATRASAFAPPTEEQLNQLKAQADEAKGRKDAAATQ